MTLVSELSPEECARRCLGGDREAFGSIYDRYAGDVQRLLIAMRIGLDHQEVEDAVQETFLRLYRGLAGLDLDKPLRHGVEIELHVAALIPESYLADVQSRLTLYKRIASAKNSGELRELQVEMIDRFGLLPDAVKTLFRISQLKLQAAKLGIKKLTANETGGKIEFEQETPVDPGVIVRLVQSEPHRYRPGTANQLIIDEKMEKPEARFSKIERLLERLTNKQVSFDS